MCGRFTLKSDEQELKREFNAATETIEFAPARYNIAPSQLVTAIRQFENERRTSDLKWGLIPFWAKDASIGNRMINARAETLAEKPSFKNALRSRRCIIPATGFYEWKRTSDSGAKAAKQPFYFYLKDKPIFGFAGLWETWTDTANNKQIESCTIITTTANATLEPVHDRMPVILKPENYEQWLDEKDVRNVSELEKLLVPYRAEEMQSHAVSTKVNRPIVDEPGLIDFVEINSE